MTNQIPHGKGVTDALTTTGPAQVAEELVSEGFATVADAAKFFSLGRSKIYEMMDAVILHMASSEGRDGYPGVRSGLSSAIR